MQVWDGPVNWIVIMQELAGYNCACVCSSVEVFVHVRAKYDSADKHRSLRCEGGKYCLCAQAGDVNTNEVIFLSNTNMANIYEHCGITIFSRCCVVAVMWFIILKVSRPLGHRKWRWCTATVNPLWRASQLHGWPRCRPRPPTLNIILFLWPGTAWLFY